MKIFKAISKPVLILSVVSFLTDISTEMLYPITPLYLKSIGFTTVLIGVLEGFAEAVAGFSKGYFGELSDRKHIRVPFIKAGYWLSAVSRPLTVAFTFPLWVFGARFLDLLGKGIRTGARDAMLSDNSKNENKATVFGFHRAMDTLGAVVGPSLGLLYLYFCPGSYKIMFLIAFIPGLLAGLTTFFLTEKKKAVEGKRKSFFASFAFIKNGPPEYKKLVWGLLFFTLFNSSNAFLILKIKEHGISDEIAIGAYIFYNLIYATFSYPMGLLADKIGLKKIFMLGLVFFTITYAGMAFNTGIAGFFILFFVYGLFMASTEGITRAWISNTCSDKDTGTALGAYAGLNSIFTLLASSIAGLIWFNYSPKATFLLTATITILVIFYFLLFVKGGVTHKKTEHIHTH